MASLRAIVEEHVKEAFRQVLRDLAEKETPVSKKPKPTRRKPRPGY
jgi:hypothetical protein